ncbi:hypothetical protein ANTPLA_LOCUS10576 [Anthophora plagiata]
MAAAYDVVLYPLIHLMASRLSIRRSSSLLRRLAIRSPDQTGDPYSTIDLATPMYSRRTPTPGPLRFGSRRPRAGAVHSTRDTRLSKCRTNLHLLSSVSPRYFIP